MKLSTIAYLSVLATAIAAQSIGSIAESQHTLAQKTIAVNGQTVVAKALDDRSVVYQPFMTRTKVAMDNGKLAVVQTTAGSRGVIVKRRAPTAAESAFWHKQFGA